MQLRAAGLTFSWFQVLNLTSIRLPSLSLVDILAGDTYTDGCTPALHTQAACLSITAFPPSLPTIDLLVRPSFIQVDMLVGDIYGGRDYSTIGLSASTIASSFGKVIGQVRDAEGMGAPCFFSREVIRRA